METTQRYFENKVAISKLTKENKILFPEFLRDCRNLINSIKLELLQETGFEITKKVAIKTAKDRIKTVINGITTNQLKIYNLVFDCINYNITIDFDKDTISSLDKKVKEKLTKLAKIETKLPTKRKKSTDKMVA